MSTIFIDFESYYSDQYSLRSISYEEYLNDPRFYVQCVGISIDLAPSYCVFGEDVGKELSRLFPPGNEHTLVAFSMSFDGAIFCWHYGLRAKEYLCTQRMAAGLWPHETNSLEKSCKLAFPRDVSIRKTHALVDFKGVRVPSDDLKDKMEQYCNNDVDISVALLKYMVRFFPVSELDIISITLKMFLHRVVEVDKPLLENYIEELDCRRIRLVEKSGVPESTLASTTKFANWIRAQGIPFEKVLAPTKRNPDNMKWSLSKDSEVFLDLRNEHPEMEDVWDARLEVASNIEATRAERVLLHSKKHAVNNKEGRLGCLFNTYAAHTLRWGGGNKSNFQNMGRGSPVRRALCAPQGNVVVVHDQSAIEARMTAWFAGETGLLDVWAQKGDIYCAFAEEFYNRRITKDADPNERFVGKVCVLGLSYQMAALRLQRTLSLGMMGQKIMLSLDKCQDIVRLYRNKYPNIPKMWSTCETVLVKMMTLEAGESEPWGCITIRKNSLQLPNGLFLQYPKLCIHYQEETASRQTVYWNGTFWVNIYGGKLLENIIQALSRILIASNIIDADKLLKQLDGSSNQVALLVHDEIVSIVLEQSAQQYYDLQSKTMRSPPDWCAEGGLTLDVEGGFAKNYIK